MGIRRVGKQLYIAEIHYDEEAEYEIRHALMDEKYRIKSKMYEGTSKELIIEILASSKNVAFADRLCAIEGVTSVKVVRCDGK